MQVLGLCGSFRKDSLNHKLLECVGDLVRAQGYDFAIYDYSNIPLYNQDMDVETKPQPVADLIKAIESADGLLIATPEYNYSVPGVLKNALDWASRPAYKSCLAHHKVAILTASMSGVGGARAQVHLRDVFSGTLTQVYRVPDFLLGSAHQAFNEQGQLLDEDTQTRLKRLIDGYLDWLV